MNVESTGQPKCRFVFSGGGMRCIALIGFLSHLQAASDVDFTSPTREVQSFCGSSGGSLIAALCYMRVDLNTAALLNRVESIVQACAAVDSISNFIKGKTTGLSSGNQVREGILETIQHYTSLVDPTFSELAQKIGKKDELVVCATNVFEYRPIYFSHKRTPDIKVCTALMASMCIPILFQPIEIGTDYFIDGGLTDNLPFTFDFIQRFNERQECIDVWLFDANENDTQVKPVKKSPPTMLQTIKALLAGSSHLLQLHVNYVSILNKVYKTMNLKKINMCCDVAQFQFDSCKMNALLNLGETYGKQFLSQT